MGAGFTASLLGAGVSAATGWGVGTCGSSASAQEYRPADSIKKRVVSFILQLPVMIVCHRRHATSKPCGHSPSGRGIPRSVEPFGPAAQS